MDDHAPGPGGGEEIAPGIVERLQVARAANWEFLRASFNACGEEPPPANGFEPSGLGEAGGYSPGVEPPSSLRVLSKFCKTKPC